jgi:hypothetical protein
MLKVKGTQSFMAKLRKHEKFVEGQVQATHQRLVKDIFTDLVKNTPQYTGNLARGWTIEFTGVSGRPETQSPEKRDLTRLGFTKYKEENEVYHRGMDPAVSATLDYELRKIPLIKYNTKVTLKNPVNYAEEVEDSEGPDGHPIRPENIHPTYDKVAMVGYVEMKYSQLRTLKRRIK